MNTRTTPSLVTDDEVEREIALCKEAVQHCMNGSGLQCIDNDIWRQFVTARAALTASDRDVLVDALIDIRNSILCPVGPTPTLDEIAEKASAALIPLAEEPSKR